MNSTTTFPSDDVLIARGKYSTLSHERKTQLERVQKIMQTLMTAAQQTLRDCEARPPSNTDPINTISKCLTNATKAREELIEICMGMESLKSLAWGDKEE